MENKKLVIVLGSMGRGGAERVISIISDHFCKKGWKVWIALLLFNEVQYELHENVTIVNLAGTEQSRIKRLPGWLFGIRKLVKEVQPHCVLSFAARINIIVQMATLGLKQKIVVSERNDPYMDGRGKIVDLLTNYFYPKAHAVVFQTKRAKGYFDKLQLKNAVVIGNPISVPMDAGESQEGKIVSAGRLTSQKNQEMLIRAFARIAHRYPKAFLTIYGEGELREELERIIAAYELEDRICLPGNVSNLHTYLADAAMFVLPSNYEGLSNALLEAMRMGLACISTNCAGSDEVITDGVSGILTDVGDEEALANAISMLIEDKEKRQILAQNAKEQTQKYEREEILKLWEKVIIS